MTSNLDEVLPFNFKLLLFPHLLCTLVLVYFVHLYTLACICTMYTCTHTCTLYNFTLYNFTLNCDTNTIGADYRFANSIKMNANLAKEEPRMTSQFIHTVVK